MEIKEKIMLFLDALATLEKGIDVFLKYERRFNKQQTEENEEVFVGMRDSLIQRFEYCTDFFWKLIKLYLEDVGKMSFGLISATGVLREAVKARLLSEEEGIKCMKMVEARNKTSHAYHEVMADEIAHEIPPYYELMKDIVERMQNKDIKE